MSNMKQAIDCSLSLSELGCKIALDDFGSGLSSFGYLKKLPVDIVKIDGLFVRDIDVNEVDHLMVRSINDLAKQMGKQTVAEFVENTRIIDILVELGVDYAQGYWIGKPKPLEELVDELLHLTSVVSPKTKSITLAPEKFDHPMEPIVQLQLISEDPNRNEQLKD